MKIKKKESYHVVPAFTRATHVNTPHPRAPNYPAKNRSFFPLIFFIHGGHKKRPQLRKRLYLNNDLFNKRTPIFEYPKLICP